MKTLTVLLTVFLSIPTLAAETSFDKFSAWMDSLLKGEGNQVTMPGTTVDGSIPCEVYITRGGPGLYYLSFGVGYHLRTDIGKNEYFGSLVTSESDVQVSGRSIKLRYTGPYVEKWVRNPNVSLDVEIDIRSDGKPVQASGQSTLQPIRQVCIFGEPIVS